MDQKTLHKLLDYDPDTGIFKWKTRTKEDFKYERDMKSFNTKFADKVCGTIDGKGYLHIGYKGKFYRLHRLAWLYVYGTLPKIIDHIDRDKRNNSISNLRNTDLQGNSLNRPANLTGNKTSKYKGVSKAYGDRKLASGEQRWQAQTKIKGVNHHLGVFKTEEEAYEAYVSFMTKTHGGDFYE